MQLFLLHKRMYVGQILVHSASEIMFRDSKMIPAPGRDVHDGQKPLFAHPRRGVNQ